MFYKIKLMENVYRTPTTTTDRPEWLGLRREILAWHKEYKIRRRDRENRSRRSSGEIVLIVLVDARESKI